jgi:protein-S-isoprenylcysteine O-methyltransferase Ste14
MARYDLTSRTALGHFVFRFRDWLSPLALGAVLVSAPFSRFVVGGAGHALEIAGIVLMVAGLLIRIAVSGYGSIRRSGLEKRISASRLLTDGPYAHTRNPLYLANIMMLSGLAAVYGAYWVAFACLPLLVFVIMSLVTAEEEFLTRRFGAEYERYRARVPRFLPRLGGLGRTLATTPFDGLRALRREYGTVFAAASAAVVLAACRRLAVYGLAESRPALAALAIVWAACVLLYVVVRRLKKAKRLETEPPTATPVPAPALSDTPSR